MWTLLLSRTENPSVPPATPTPSSNRQQTTTLPPPSTERETKEITTPPEKTSKGSKESTESPSTDSVTTRLPSGEPVTSITHSTESQSTGATEDQPHINNDSIVANASSAGENSTSIGESRDDMETELANAEQAIRVLQSM